MIMNSRLLLICCLYCSALLLFFVYDNPILPLLHAFSFSSTTSSTPSRLSSSSSSLLRASSTLDSTATTTPSSSTKASINNNKKTTTKAAAAATAATAARQTTTSATVNGVTASVITTPTTSSSNVKADGKNGKRSSFPSSSASSSYTVNAKLEDIINNNGSDSDSDPTGRRRRRGPQSSSSSSSSPSSVTDVNDFDIDDQINGKVGDWENLFGNWVLRPSSSWSSSSSSSNYGSTSDVDGEEPPRALLHVLGGALVGAAPHITYRYVLERLADEGFLIVATPYKLSFNHLQTCDEVLTKFENVAPMIAREYGALPVVGVGHSCGALLQLLITCLFPDTPRAANALLSFNNKPVTEAVPFFEEIFAPAFTSLATPPPRPAAAASSAGSPSSSSSQPPTRQQPLLSTSNDSVKVGLKLARAATKGELPSDELLTEAVRCVGANAIPPFMETLLPPFPFGGVGSGIGGKQQEDQQQIEVPQQVRDAFKTWAAPSVTALSESGVLPIFHQTVVSLEQIPMLVDEVAEGARDFNPTPALVRAAAGKAYRARRTLVLGYDDDSIDESDEVEEVLREARSITRMRRPMVPIDVERDTLQGGHVTPLTAPPLEVASKTEDLLGVETARERLGYAQAEATVQRLLRWLEEGNL
eukprot:CAMPEP_0113484418 /NCGR_PEP_ID=MMETSP0014_2-20120614/23951_1 /TAXON_ID=2857 /ORGANISM="Nitzschia sp." /LENGTH=644 /DNA_ID=CAMNT_0000378019 /DNA_START=453 /DNA_END=2387 /DNA_ORIENTATION=- /assembly_acc=CAM_ASM_000159